MISDKYHIAGIGDQIKENRTKHEQPAEEKDAIMITQELKKRKITAIRESIEDQGKQLLPKQGEFLSALLEFVIQDDTRASTHAAQQVNIGYGIVTGLWPSQSETFRRIADAIKTLDDPAIPALESSDAMQKKRLLLMLPQSEGFVYAAAEKRGIHPNTVLLWMRKDQEFGAALLKAIDKIDNLHAPLTTEQKKYIDIFKTSASFKETNEVLELSYKQPLHWFNENLSFERAVVEAVVEHGRKPIPLTDEQEAFLTVLRLKGGNLTHACQELGIEELSKPYAWAHSNPAFKTQFRDEIDKRKQVLREKREAPRELTDVERRFLDELEKTGGNKQAAARNMGKEHVPHSKSPEFKKAVEEKMHMINAQVEQGAVIREMKLKSDQKKFLKLFKRLKGDKSETRKHMDDMPRWKVNGWLEHNPTFAKRFVEIEEKHQDSGERSR